MPLHWTILHDERLATLQSEGTLRYGEIERYLEAMSAEGALRYRMLFDLREGYSDLNEQELMAYAGSISGYVRLQAPGPHAVVVGEHLRRVHEPLLRMMYVTRTSPLRMFSNYGDAQKWLGAQLVAAPQMEMAPQPFMRSRGGTNSD